MPGDELPCALCADTQATHQLANSGAVARRIVMRYRLDLAPSEVIVPVCGDCQRYIEDVLDTYRAPGNPEQKSFASDDVFNIVAKLDPTPIEVASEATERS